MQKELINNLIELARYQDIYVLVADLGQNLSFDSFGKEYPDRYFDIGIAEQNMMSIAAGIALAGGIPFVGTFACYAALRACEQVRTSVAYQNLPVRIVGSHAGLSVGENGASHQCLEDLAIVRTIPNMTVLSPANRKELSEMVMATWNMPGPVYYRLPRNSTLEYIPPFAAQFKLGQAQMVQNGWDITIISVGYILHEVMKAVKLLEDKGLSVRVLNMGSIKPIDIKIIRKAMLETKAILTVEDHSQIGGLYAAVMEALQCCCYVNVRSVGVKDRFGESGNYIELLKKYGMDANAIYTEALYTYERQSKKNET
jgi:transketolase